MGYYEIMLIISPEVETDGHQEVLNDLKTAITKEGGVVSTVLDWRKRRLAYEISKHKEGYYYLVYFSGHGTVIPEVEHYFRVTDAVIRYMIVSVEEKEFNAAAEKAAEAAAAAAAQAEKQEQAELEKADEATVIEESEEPEEVEEPEEPEEVEEPEEPKEPEEVEEPVAAEEPAETVEVDAAQEAEKKDE